MINDGNLDNMLVRKELFELILRLSLIKYWSVSKDPNAIKMCFEKFVNEIYPIVPIRVNDFRMFVKDKTEINRAWSCNKVFVKLCFKH